MMAKNIQPVKPDNHSGFIDVKLLEKVTVKAGKVSINTKYEKQSGFIKHSGFIKGSA